MHGVAPQMCHQVARPLLGGEAGGRSSGFLFDRRPAPAVIATGKRSGARQVRRAPLRVRLPCTPSSEPRHGPSPARPGLLRRSPAATWCATADGQALAYVYSRGTEIETIQGEARRIAADMAREG
jgi:hypothetical protein